MTKEKPTNQILQLYRIISGEFQCLIGNQLYIYKQPTPAVLFRSEQEYNLTIEMYRNEVLSQQDMLLNMVSLDLWSPQLESEYHGFDKKLENLKISLYEAYLGYKKRDRIKEDIEKLRGRYKTLSSKRSLYDFCTLETLANEVKINYIVLNSLEPKIEDDPVLINKIISLIFVQYVSDDMVRDLSKLSEV